MQTAEARLKRIFVVRLEEGERLPDAIELLARKKKIRSAVVLLLGGARDGTLVVGPSSSRRKKHSVLTESFGPGHEIMGIGTIFAGAKGPEMHLHAATGRGNKTLVGCGRTGLKVNFIIEAVIFELAGLAARRAFDPATGFHLLTLSR